MAAKTWRVAQENIAGPSCGSADLPGDVATGKVEHVADLHDLRPANVVDYRLAGLPRRHVPLVSAASTVNRWICLGRALAAWAEAHAVRG